MANQARDAVAAVHAALLGVCRFGVKGEDVLAATTRMLEDFGSGDDVAEELSTNFEPAKDSEGCYQLTTVTRFAVDVGGRRRKSSCVIEVHSSSGPAKGVWFTVKLRGAVRVEVKEGELPFRHAPAVAAMVRGWLQERILHESTA